LKQARVSGRITDENQIALFGGQNDLVPIHNEKPPGRVDEQIGVVKVGVTEDEIQRGSLQGLPGFACAGNERVDFDLLFPPKNGQLAGFWAVQIVARQGFFQAGNDRDPGGRKTLPRQLVCQARRQPQAVNFLEDGAQFPACIPFSPAMNG